MSTKKRIALAKKIAAQLFTLSTRKKADHLMAVTTGVMEGHERHHGFWTEDQVAVRVLRVLEEEGI